MRGLLIRGCFCILACWLVVRVVAVAAAVQYLLRVERFSGSYGREPAALLGMVYSAAAPREEYHNVVLRRV